MWFQPPPLWVRHWVGAKSLGAPYWQRKDERQCISPVVIYRKCTQRTTSLLYGKRQLIDKNSEPKGAPPPVPSPFNQPLLILSSFPFPLVK